MKLNNFLVSEGASLRNALLQIDANRHGVIFTTNLSGQVIGLATDGDIRRKLLGGSSLDESIALSANAEFVWATSDTSREMLLKKLDHRIRVIPLLDANRYLTGIVSRDHLPIQVEEPVYARSRSPVRISFGGGLVF